MPERPVVVVKVGTSTLCDGQGELDLNFVRALVRQLVGLRDQGWAPVLVSSGAIRAGMRRLGLTRLRNLAEQQAAAAVGQIDLMRTYTDSVRAAGAEVGQVLLTRDDVADRGRYLNARNTLLALLQHHVMPVVNENDTVAVEEIEFGDNDQLAAQVVQLTLADCLVLLTDVDGLMMPDSLHRPRLVETAPAVTDDMLAAAGGSRSGLGRGGMSSKLLAARMATRVGASAIIARGKVDGLPQLPAILDGSAPATRIGPASRTLRGRKRWLAQSGGVEGTLVIDDGAARAVAHGGGSLLAVGVREVQGMFEQGALVRVVTVAGQEVGRGLVNYTADECRRIQGQRSDAIGGLLGYQGGPEIIHRDNWAANDVTVLPVATPVEET